MPGAWSPERGLGPQPNTDAEDAASCVTTNAQKASLPWDHGAAQRGCRVGLWAGFPDDIALLAIDAGAEDVKTEGDYVEVYTEPGRMEDVRNALEESFKVVSAEVSRVPKTTVMLDDAKAGQVMSFLDQLEQLDDVQRVYSNADFSDSALQGLEQA